jgi:uncharacterized protein YyaL (SSP411 family)
MGVTFVRFYDPKLGGWGNTVKFLDWDALDYAITQGAAGDSQMTVRARQTLTAGLKLVDPVWGGVDQYSVNGDWDHPHFEKIMPFQAETIRILCSAATRWNEFRWLVTADKIHSYLSHFLTSPDGAFYTSQDADLIPGIYADNYFALGDAARRKLGIPRVDTHIYASNNGLAITGLTALYAANGDPSTLAAAERAAHWVIVHRALSGGGFGHDAHDQAGPYLADTLQMGRAFLALYSVTADRTWLARASSATDFIQSHFKASAGYATSVATASSAPPPQPEVDENVTLARFANLLAHYSGRPSDRDIATHAMQYLAAPAVIEGQRSAVAGILLADEELRTVPTHIVIVGAKSDSAARALFTAALRYAPPYKRIEWYDPKEGPLPNADVEYPRLSHAEAFICSSMTCSSPLSSEAAIARKFASIGH